MWRQCGAEIKRLDLLLKNLDNSPNSVSKNRMTTNIDSIKSTIYVTSSDAYRIQAYEATVILL